MSKVLATNYENKNTFSIDYQVDKDTYTKFRDEVVDQIVKNTEVKGFRKGKAPKKVAMKSIDPSMMAQTLMREIIVKFSPAAVEEAQKIVEKDGREMYNVDVDYSQDNTKELEDGSFQLRMLVSLYPDIDLGLFDKMKIKIPTDKDVKDFPAEKKYLEQEEANFLKHSNEFTEADEKVKLGHRVTAEMSGSVDGVFQPNLDAKDMKVVVGDGLFLPQFETNLVGMKAGESKSFDLDFPSDYAPEMAGKTAKVDVQVKLVESPKYSSLKELFPNNEGLVERFETYDKYVESVKLNYVRHKESIVESMQREAVVNKVVNDFPDFELDSEAVESETTRIFGAMENEAKVKQIPLEMVLKSSGISAAAHDKIDKMKDEEIKKEVENYVRKEMKLTNLLTLIYQKKVDEKPEQKQVLNTIEEAFKNKKKFDIPEEAGKEEVDGIIRDRVVRQYAGNWMFNKIITNSAAKKMGL